MMAPFWEPNVTFAVATHDRVQPYCYLAASVYGAGTNSQSVEMSSQP